MTVTAAGQAGKLTMSCEIERRRPTRARREAHHADCVRPRTCPCPEHAKDDERARQITDS